MWSTETGGLVNYPRQAVGRALEDLIDAFDLFGFGALFPVLIERAWGIS